ncbi:glycerophosphodiester phosphodiesterase family protein [Rhizomonospora bruguierae]|uniref:glycerophosphodiester phosphodiesterase family protein n=1 Tax=Rhizomonospora bruguierae TaxID=1581705 RepID=UPI001BCC1583|nr:glycerophosphodiester phosphodiesterase family protein [Micromonospora sp. NBRC 107566]
MSVRRALASLAVVPALAALPAPTAAVASPNNPGVVLPQKTHFDLQAHRGGIGMTTEESPEGFAKAMRLGVSTLELDTHVTKDEKVVVNHDRQISAQKCRDTAPVTPGDPMYPYVGKYIKDLTLAQLKTMDCGYQVLPDFPEQEQIKGFRMVELKDVLNLVKSYHANQVMLNIETKVEAGAPEQTAPRELFVRAAAIPGVTALSPVYGFPQNGKLGEAGFRFYVDEVMVSAAHARGLKVIPWTCDAPATVEALIDMGIDGIITNYPNRVRQIMAERGMRLPKVYEAR